MVHGKNFIGGNWKCNGTKQSVTELVTMLNEVQFDSSKVDVVVSPPALYLDMVQKALKKEVQVSAQNVSLTKCGAFTGELAASQLKDFGLNWTLTGHSERRAMYGETDEIVAKKTKIALENDLKVIACIGETLQEREAEKTTEVVFRQLKAIADVLNAADWANVVVAYEPVWAIGTGKVATPQQAQEVHEKLRGWVAANVSAEVAESLRIIYGGSVKAENCNELIALTDVDGFLVGGASLQPQFATIIQSAL